MILKFEKLRQDVFNKIKTASSGTEPSLLGTASLKEKAYLISIVFGSLRFALTRFGRVINLYDALHQTHKKKRFAVSIPKSM